jgi:1,4-alpha-glucan branching enzyme
MPKSPIGSFALVLHSHLPYVLSHGSWPHGTDWLNEAAAETYIPLLDGLTDLIALGRRPHLTIGITPILTEQLADPGFRDGFSSYLDNHILAATKDEQTFASWKQDPMVLLAQRWRDYYASVKDHFDQRYGRDLVGAFRKLQDQGYIEIITCAATHGYLPLLSADTSVQAQVRQGVSTYRRHYGRAPRGIWLPECAYRPRYSWTSPVSEEAAPYLRKGVEEFLSESGIEYFLIDSHLLKGGKAIGVYLDRFEALQRLWGQFSREYRQRPEEAERTPHEVYLVGSGLDGKKPVAVFTRDPKTALQVWSGEWGYPGDGWYLDFHKKHFPGGLRYWRVTSPKSDLGDKQPYEPDRIEGRINENADHFVALVKDVLREYHGRSGKKGILCAPFDAELFGHWWFEGPRWIARVFSLIEDDPELELTTCSRFLDESKPSAVISLPEGSWGEGGFHYIWLNDWTKWTWAHVYEAEKELRDLLSSHGSSGDGNMQNILRQAARELLLLQSSDWQFLISTWSARDYAELRFGEHYEDFKRLAGMARRYGSGEWVDPGEWTFLGDCEKRDAVFPDLDLRWFEKVEFPA